MNVDTIVELNVGGKIFATTVQTLSREVSLLSTLPHSGRRDKDGRFFIDRDHTYFRWILNYLRDGYLVTAPATQQERLELLQEARYFQLQNLIQYLEQSPSLNQETNKEAPTFLTARPSTKGIFFLPGVKWNTLYPMYIKENWDIIGIKFEESKEEVAFVSICFDRLTNTLLHTETICHSKLSIDRTAKAVIQLDSPQGQQTCDVVFWWEPSNTPYPQLYARITRGDNQPHGLDFVCTTTD